MQVCREYGLPDPVLRYDDSGFWVEFAGENAGYDSCGPEAGWLVKYSGASQADHHLTAKIVTMQVES